MTAPTIEERFYLLIVCILVLVFYALQYLLRAFVKGATAGPARHNPNDIYKISRIAAAAVVLRFMVILVTVTMFIAFGIGVLKPFVDLVNPILPERMLGLILLIGYCGLVSVFSAVHEDLTAFFKGLFAQIRPSPRPPTIT